MPFMLASTIIFAQKSLPGPPENLPSSGWFNDELFTSNDKSEGIFEEGLEVYVSEESDQLRQLLDSIANGWGVPNLTHLEVKWNLDPQAPDSSKNLVIRKGLSQLSRLDNIKTLKTISFSIGEGMFITSEDKLEYYDKRGQKENMLRASTAITAELKKLTIKPKVYASSWGW